MRNRILLAFAIAVAAAFPASAHADENEHCVVKTMVGIGDHVERITVCGICIKVDRLPKVCGPVNGQCPLKPQSEIVCFED